MNRNLIIAVILILVLALGGYYYSQRNSVAVENNGEVVPGETTGRNNNVTNGSMNALTGNTWVWQETQMNDGSVVKPKKADAFTITFTKDGQATGTTDCNSFFTSFNINGGEINWSDMGSTLMFCADSQETEFLQMLQNSNGFIFDPQGNLVLLIKFDSGSVLFKKK